MQAGQRLEDKILAICCGRPVRGVECSSSLLGRDDNGKEEIKSPSPMFAKTSLKCSLLPSMPTKHPWGRADEPFCYARNRLIKSFVKSFAERLCGQCISGILIQAGGKSARHPFRRYLIGPLIKARTSPKSHIQRLRRGGHLNCRDEMGAINLGPPSAWEGLPYRHAHSALGPKRRRHLRLSGLEAAAAPRPRLSNDSVVAQDEPPLQAELGADGARVCQVALISRAASAPSTTVMTGSKPQNGQHQGGHPQPMIPLAIRFRVI
jgi:hypothetical protein